MPVRQRELTVREENDLFLLNRGIIPQEQASAPISFQIAPESGGAHNAATGLQGGVLPNQYYHLTAAQHAEHTESGSRNYPFYISS